MVSHMVLGRICVSPFVRFPSSFPTSNGCVAFLPAGFTRFHPEEEDPFSGSLLGPFLGRALSALCNRRLATTSRWHQIGLSFVFGGGGGGGCLGILGRSCTKKEGLFWDAREGQVPPRKGDRQAFGSSHLQQLKSIKGAFGTWKWMGQPTLLRCNEPSRGSTCWSLKELRWVQRTHGSQFFLGIYSIQGRTMGFGFPYHFPLGRLRSRGTRSEEADSNCSSSVFFQVGKRGQNQPKPKGHTRTQNTTRNPILLVALKGNSQIPCRIQTFALIQARYINTKVFWGFGGVFAQMALLELRWRCLAWGSVSEKPLWVLDIAPCNQCVLLI